MAWVFSRFAHDEVRRLKEDEFLCPAHVATGCEKLIAPSCAQGYDFGPQTNREIRLAARSAGFVMKRRYDSDRLPTEQTSLNGGPK